MSAFIEEPLPQFAIGGTLGEFSAEEPEVDWMKTVLLFFDGIAVRQWDFDLHLERHAFWGALHDYNLLQGFGGQERNIQPTLTALRAAPYPLACIPRAEEIVQLLPDDVRPRERITPEIMIHSDFVYMLTEAIHSREAAQVQGFELNPVTQYAEYATAVVGAAHECWPVAVADIIALDLQTVCFSLESVPLDEVVDFRRQYGQKFRAYRRSIDSLITTCTQLPPQDRRKVITRRREELRDLSDELQRQTRLSFRLRRLVPFGLGLAGAAFTGDYMGAAGSALGAVIDPSAPSTNLGAFSYLFQAQHNWRGR